MEPHEVLREKVYVLNLLIKNYSGIRDIPEDVIMWTKTKTR